MSEAEGSDADLPPEVACKEIPEAGAFRIARRDSPLALSRISVADAEMPFSGNRYDVSGGGVLYCATNLEGCYAETLARYRPSPRIIAALGLHTDGYMNVGSVPADWRLRRVKTRVICQEPLPFVDVEDPCTLATLGELLAKDLAALDIQQPLDVSLMRGRNRLVPRLVLGGHMSNRTKTGPLATAASDTSRSSGAGSAGPSSTGHAWRRPRRWQSPSRIPNSSTSLRCTSSRSTDRGGLRDEALRRRSGRTRVPVWPSRRSTGCRLQAGQ